MSSSIAPDRMEADDYLQVRLYFSAKEIKFTEMDKLKIEKLISTYDVHSEYEGQIKFIDKYVKLLEFLTNPNKRVK